MTALQLTVADVVDESHDARSIVFEEPLDYRPGQFLTVRVPSTTTGFVARCYSLASSPHTDDTPKVTVKRTDGGYASNWLCDNISTGDVVDVLAPSGVFTPDCLDTDFLLWAAGSGITPVMSILKSVLAAGAGRVVLIYANRDERSVIFAAELRDLESRHPDRLTVVHWLESVQGLPGRDSLTRLAARLGGDTHQSYVCGPGPFMDAVQAALSDVGAPRSSVHVEVFRSLTGDPFTIESGGDDDDAATVAVDLDGTQHRLRWPRNSTLVDVMIAAGIDVPYSCREGQCGSCACTVTGGEVDMPASDILEREDLAAGLILGCQARPVTDDVSVEF